MCQIRYTVVRGKDTATHSRDPALFLSQKLGRGGTNSEHLLPFRRGPTVDTSHRGVGIPKNFKLKAKASSRHVSKSGAVCEPRALCTLRCTLSRVKEHLLASEMRMGMTHEEVPNDSPGWPLLLTHAELMTCLVSTETELGEAPSENLLQLGAWLSFLSCPGASWMTWKVLEMAKREGTCSSMPSQEWAEDGISWQPPSPLSLLQMVAKATAEIRK